MCEVSKGPSSSEAPRLRGLMVCYAFMGEGIPVQGKLATPESLQRRCYTIICPPLTQINSVFLLQLVPRVKSVLKCLAMVCPNEHESLY